AVAHRGGPRRGPARLGRRLLALRHARRPRHRPPRLGTGPSLRGDRGRDLGGGGRAWDRAPARGVRERLRRHRRLRGGHGRRDVDYLRVRSGPSVDVGVAVFGGHLVVGSPPASLHAAIDVHLGAPPAAGVVWRTYESLGRVGGDVVAYDLTDAPAFLRGLARA